MTGIEGNFFYFVHLFLLLFILLYDLWYQYIFSYRHVKVYRQAYMEKV